MNKHSYSPEDRKTRRQADGVWDGKKEDRKGGERSREEQKLKGAERNRNERRGAERRTRRRDIFEGNDK